MSASMTIRVAFVDMHPLALVDTYSELIVSEFRFKAHNAFMLPIRRDGKLTSNPFRSPSCDDLQILNL